MAFEDFTTYVEVDSGGDITVIATRVTWANMDRDAISYVYKDFTPGHFGNFEHLIETQLNSDQNESHAATWVLANLITTLSDIWNNNRDALVLLHNEDAGNYRFVLRDGVSGNEDSFLGAASTLYYCKVTRAGTTITVRFYSDAARTVLVDTITVAGSSTTMRYLYACMSKNDPNVNREAAGFSQNFDLQDVVAATGSTIYFFDGTNNIELQRDDASPVQMWNGVEIVGLKLGNTNDPNASPFQVFTTTIKAILRMP